MSSPELTRSTDLSKTCLINSLRYNPEDLPDAVVDHQCPFELETGRCAVTALLHDGVRQTNNYETHCEHAKAAIFVKETPLENPYL